MPELRLAFQPFPAQEAHFRRKVNVPSARWDALKRSEHAHGFMVAGLARLDVLDDIRRAVQDAISKGETLEDFRKRFDAAVAGKWSGFTGDGSAKGRAWRTRIIYQTNLRTSYMAGHWETLQRFAYLRYQHNTAVNFREAHKALDDKIIARDDPWWDTHYPPNGWGCRCSVTGVSEAGLRALRGKDGKPDAPPAPDKDNPPPPEWAYHVGKQSRSMAAAEQFGKKVMGLPPEWRKIALDDAQQRQVEWFTPSWRGHADSARQALDTGRPMPTGAASPVGFLSSNAVSALQASGLDPSSALLAMTDRQVIHAMRDAKQGQVAILLEAVRSLPEWVGSEDTLIFKDGTSLQLARWLGGKRYVVAVIRLGSLQSRATDRIEANWITTLKVIGPAEIGKLERLK